MEINAACVIASAVFKAVAPGDSLAALVRTAESIIGKMEVCVGPGRCVLFLLLVAVFRSSF